MPAVFDIVGLVNNVREPISDDGDELEDNPFFTDEENPLLRMDSIGQLEEIDEEDTEVTDGEEDTFTNLRGIEKSKVSVGGALN